jgi:hypothetical protein
MVIGRSNACLNDPSRAGLQCCINPLMLISVENIQLSISGGADFYNTKAVFDLLNAVEYLGISLYLLRESLQHLIHGERTSLGHERPLNPISLRAPLVLDGKCAPYHTQARVMSWIET